MSKPPSDCNSLDDIREGIDGIDRTIVGLLAARMGYVKAAARFKPTEASIAAPDRVAAMLIDRRAWAQDAALPPGGVEALFSHMIHWYIDQQTLHWRERRQAREMAGAGS